MTLLEDEVSEGEVHGEIEVAELLDSLFDWSIFVCDVKILVSKKGIVNLI